MRCFRILLSPKNAGQRRLAIQDPNNSLHYLFTPKQLSLAERRPYSAEAIGIGAAFVGVLVDPSPSAGMV
jgi:hypothetical protein